VRRRHGVELSVDRFLQQERVVCRTPAEQAARFELVDEALQIAGSLVQIPGDDGKTERAIGDLKDRAGGAAAERQRERDDDESSETAV
jgi:hypothetical protein